MRIFFIFITAYTIRVIRFKRPFKLVLNILFQELRSWSRRLPTLLALFACHCARIYNAFEIHIIRNFLGVFNLAWGTCHLAPIVHDRKESRRVEHNSALCVVFRILQNLLPSPLVDLCLIKGFTTGKHSITRHLSQEWRRRFSMQISFTTLWKATKIKESLTCPSDQLQQLVFCLYFCCLYFVLCYWIRDFK